MSTVPTINEEEATTSNSANISDPNVPTNSVSASNVSNPISTAATTNENGKKTSGNSTGNNIGLSSPRSPAIDRKRRNSLRRLSREVPRLPSTGFSVLNEETEAKKKNEKSEKKKPKKQQPSAFLHKSIKLGKLKSVDSNLVMLNLLNHVKAEEQSWDRLWKCLKVSNLFIVVSIMGINLVQVLINLVGLKEQTIKVVSTCLPVISSLLISFKNKFSWDDKSEISKTSVEFYRKMIKHIESRIRLEKVGATVTDAINLWNASLVHEMKAIPQAVVPY